MSITDRHRATEPTPRAAPWQAEGATIRIWDPFVRIFHWSLVLAVGLAALTGFILGRPWLDIHVWAGTAAGALVMARLVWGLYGTHFARFASFVVHPRTAWAHFQELVTGDAPRHLGHNPLGAWMIVALFLIIPLTVLSGAVLLGGVFKTGPLAALVDFRLGSLIGESHELFANWLLALVLLHVAGAIYESRRTAENLPLTMVTGRKQLRPGDRLPDRLSPARPLLAAALILLLLGGLGWGAARLAALPPRGGQLTALDPTYASECGDCHSAYHPSLLPADRWRRVMATLDDHFGEDASLDADTTARLTAWLTANAAETADTLPAHAFRKADPAQPLRITATPLWRAFHAPVDPATFRRAPIFTAANCEACHQDAASGHFYPGNIRIPKETVQ